ncbi:LysR substrate-binding domain-containing protein [Pseudochrobactrum sp. HB0163]|uniref:LysR substrate-binding domain-containing protein n=1 Tax=Pseudochrobactrum sp. HB0163 TaxID=3450708 RepID=UPI003F6DD450
MRDLNDLRFFVVVVEQGGFAAAARKLNMPRSRLSRRIGILEESLGVRLIQRTTRHFAVTDIGREYYRHCVAMLVEADAAQEVIDRMRSEPQGVIRISCPPTMVHFQIGDMLTRFMKQNPKVEILLDSTSRRVDVVREGYDLALRVRFPPLDDSDLIIRKFAESPQRLVAHPALIAGCKHPPQPDELAQLPSLAWDIQKTAHEWYLENRDGANMVIRHQPRLLTEDMVTLRLAALQGLGICQLPAMVVRDDLRAGRLVDVLPGWAPRSGITHAAFPSRRGLLPSVRSLLDFLAEEYARLARENTDHSG